MSLLLEKVTVGDQIPDLAYPVTATTVVLGALASRDWRPMHHDHDFAVNRNGTRDIFLNTPNQAGWIERYVTDWTGPRGRLGKLRFRMRRSRKTACGSARSCSGQIAPLVPWGRPSARPHKWNWWRRIADTARVQTWVEPKYRRSSRKAPQQRRATTTE